MPGRILRNGTNTTVDLSTPGYVEIDATGGGGGASIVQVTQAEYDAIAIPDPDTLYVITDAAGRTVLAGSGVPDPGLGLNDDFYIDSSNWDIYGPKTGGVWGSATSLIGPSGGSSAAYTVTVQAGATYMLTAPDMNTKVRFTHSAPVVTVPNIGSAGDWVVLRGVGGPLTLEEDTGVTVTPAAGQSLVTVDAGAEVMLIKVASGAWEAVGRLAATA